MMRGKGLTTEEHRGEWRQFNLFVFKQSLDDKFL